MAKNPKFWTSIFNSREPLRSNKWIISFDSEGENENNLFGAKECSKPSYDISVTEHKHISGHVYRLPGTLKWKPINIKFASVSAQVLDTNDVEDGLIVEIFKGNSLSYDLGEFLKKFGYENPSSFNTSQKINKENSISPKMSIYQLDYHGYKQETWELFNPFISNINFGNLSYSSEEIVDVTVTLQYDYASLTDEVKSFRESGKR